MVKYTEEEINKLKEIISGVNKTGNIPGNDRNLVWNRYKEITGSTEPQPCNCRGAGSHWYRATHAIASYLDKLEGNEVV